MKAMILWALAMAELMQLVAIVRRCGGDIDVAIGNMSLAEFVKARAHAINSLFLCNLAGIAIYWP